MSYIILGLIAIGFAEDSASEIVDAMTIAVTWIGGLVLARMLLCRS